MGKEYIQKGERRKRRRKGCSGQLRPRPGPPSSPRGPARPPRAQGLAPKRGPTTPRHTATSWCSGRQRGKISATACAYSPSGLKPGGARPALVNRLRLRKTKGSSAQRQPFACEPCRGRRGASPGITSPARAVGRTETLAINPAVRAASAWRLTAPLQRAFLALCLK